MIKISYDILYDLYWIKNLSQKKIGSIYNCTQSNIHRLFKKFNILCKSTGHQAIKHGKSCINKKYYCVDCNKEISDYRHIRCVSCSNIYKGNQQKGINSKCFKDGRTLKLHKCNICDNDITYIKKFNGSGICKFCANQLHSFRIKNKFTGKLNNNYKNGNFCNRNCCDCGKKISKGKIEKRCQSCATKRRFLLNPTSHPWFGKSHKHCRYYLYKNIWFKSSWEANFAKWCDLSGIKWEYETKAFELEINNKLTTYTPDFYLSEFDLWIEVKGYWYKDAEQKFEKFKKIYSKLKIDIFEKNQLKMLGIINV